MSGSLQSRTIPFLEDYGVMVIVLVMCETYLHIRGRTIRKDQLRRGDDPTLFNLTRTVADRPSGIFARRVSQTGKMRIVGVLAGCKMPRLSMSISALKEQRHRGLSITHAKNSLSGDFNIEILLQFRGFIPHSWDERIEK